jgi:hypothetical protein
MDLSWVVHWPKLVVWLAYEGLLLALSVLLYRTPAAAGATDDVEFCLAPGFEFDCSMTSEKGRNDAHACPCMPVHARPHARAACMGLLDGACWAPPASSWPPLSCWAPPAARRPGLAQRRSWCW